MLDSFDLSVVISNFQFSSQSFTYRVVQVDLISFLIMYFSHDSVFSSYKSFYLIHSDDSTLDPFRYFLDSDSE